MIELFEQDIKTNDRQPSKGNQLKWENDGIWYKADYTGYEGLSEYVISELMKKSSMKENEYVLYSPIEIKYKNRVYTGAYSKNFLMDNFEIVTLERLFKTYYGKSLHSCIWTIRDVKERLSFIVSSIEKITGIKDFGKYMNKVLTIDAFFLNEDRHTHNLAILSNSNNEFMLCPIFDNGAGLLSDTTMDYPLDMDIYKLIDSVKGKTISSNLEEQMEASKDLYGMNLKLEFTKKDIDDILSRKEALIYSEEIRNRVRKVVYEQMRKYPYLF
jgi:hypothetical protein